MKYEGDAVQYTAFAIVAIESVWPNPDGNELLPDDTDLALINAEASTYKSDTRGSFGVTNTSSEGVVTERDYHGKQGYYKVLPLNVTLAKTNSTLNGSNFTVTFTLDDLLLITSESDFNAFRYATGIPMSSNDLVESELTGALPQLLDAKSEGGDWTYVRDSDLGLSRYRVSGASSSFNVEDLVEVNDTITIWMYHDPQDFYFKDRLPEQDFFDDEGGLLRFNESIKNVIGSGDRRNQFGTDKRSFDEKVLGDMGIINEIISESMESLISSGAEEDVVVSQIPRVDKGNLFEYLMNFMFTATSAQSTLNIDTRVAESVNGVFAGLDPAQLEMLQSMIKKLYRPTSSLPVSDEGATLETSSMTQRVAGERQTVNSIIQLLPAGSGPMLFDYDASSYSEELSELFNSIELHSEDERVAFVLGLNLFAANINIKTEEYATQYLRSKRVSRSRQTFVNGRTALINEAHGETPYLALKGSISSITTNVGTSEGSYTVTISGTGYEKVLKDSEVYYEDLFYLDSLTGPASDFQSIYVNMSPPRAIQHLINRWAPKQVVFGTPNEFSADVTHNWFHIETLTTTGTDPNEARKFSTKFGPDVVPLRGVFTLAEIGAGGEPGDIKLFTPVNYLDISRIQEMVRTLDKAYATPDVEAAMVTSVNVQSRISVMENIRRMGGAANFYQYFVDEAGRFRYRLSFEAIERTPKPEYIPTIQDYDVLGDGSSFSVDDSELVTVVDVAPVVNSFSMEQADLGFRGRSIPEPGKVPLIGLEDIDPDMTSPELYRYGFRGLKLEDIYQSETGGAIRKAVVYRGFYGQPIKKATIRLRNNTSYRVGETVLVSLQKNKKRSRALIDLNRWITWLTNLKGDPDLMRMYIGVDERLLRRAKDSFVLTAGEYNPFGDSGVAGGVGLEFYNKFNADPHLFVLEAFLKTFEYMRDTLSGVNIITPEYFPNLYWYYAEYAEYAELPGGAYGWDENRVDDEKILEAHTHSLKASVLGDSASAERLREILASKENPGIINSLRFQNFRASSYFIDLVSHNFSYGADATTSISGTFGQDNLVLLDPVNLLPFGFISLERKMRILDEAPSQVALWQDYPSTYSSLQSMYIEQFKEDDRFKRASFLYNSQYYRNASNYMYEIGVVREGLDTYVDFDYGNEIDSTSTPDSFSGERQAPVSYVAPSGRVVSDSTITGDRTEVDTEAGTRSTTTSSGEKTTETLSQDEIEQQEAVVNYERDRDRLVGLFRGVLSDANYAILEYTVNLYEAARPPHERNISGLADFIRSETGMFLQ